MTASSTRSPWFTLEPLDPTTYAISEYGHWEETHAYLLLGVERAALIDTGLGIGKIEAVVADVTSLPVVVLTTHVHWDHIGGHGTFAERCVHPAERAWLETAFPLPTAVVRQQLMREPLRQPAPAGFDPAEYVPFQGPSTRRLNDGDWVDLGGRRLTALHTPGHSPGHLCFHEPSRGYLFTGDLVYAGTLYANYPSTDPAQFAASTARMASLPHVARLLPGHHALGIPLGLLSEANAGWQDLAKRGILRHGAGAHTYGAVTISV